MELLYTATGNEKYIPSLGYSHSVFQKLIHKTTTLSSKYTPREIKTHPQKRHIQISIILIAKNWNVPKYASTSKSTQRIGIIHTMKYYSAIKWNRLLTHSISWMELKNTPIDEVS